MKKIILIIAIGLALLANADYIYWMVDNPATGTDISNTAVEGGFNWENAVLSVQESSAIYVNSTYSDASSVALDGGTLSRSDASALSSYDAYAYANIGGDYSGKYFLIELFATDGSWMAGYSVSAANSDIAKYIFANNSMSVMPANGFGQGVSYSVPEPTSGLLFLIGGMLLGLKRRRQQV